MGSFGRQRVSRGAILLNLFFMNMTPDVPRFEDKIESRAAKTQPSMPTELVRSNQIICCEQSLFFRGINCMQSDFHSPLSKAENVLEHRVMFYVFHLPPIFFCVLAEIRKRNYNARETLAVGCNQ